MEGNKYGISMLGFEDFVFSTLFSVLGRNGGLSTQWWLRKHLQHDAFIAMSRLFFGSVICTYHLDIWRKRIFAIVDAMMCSQC